MFLQQAAACMAIAWVFCLLLGIASGRVDVYTAAVSRGATAETTPSSSSTDGASSEGCFLVPDKEIEGMLPSA